MNIRDIGAEPRRIQRRLDHAWVSRILAASRVDLESGEAGARLAVEVDRRGSTVFLRGELHGLFHVACSRCLEPAAVRVDEPDLHLTFVRAAAGPAEERELSADDLDVYEHEGRVIDLEPVVRELLVVGIPIAPLCRDDCRGICTGCGRNLNHESCACEGAGETAPGWKGALARVMGELPTD